MMTKFIAERDCWPHVERSSAAAPTFEEYCAEVLSFVGEWVHLHRAQPIAEISAEIGATPSIARFRQAPKTWERDPRVRKLVNFFYLHGN